MKAALKGHVRIVKKARKPVANRIKNEEINANPAPGPI